MTFGVYWKGAVWELVLTFLASTALLYTLLNGFYVDEGLQHGPIPAIACLVSLIILFSAAYNSTSLRIGAVVYVLAALGTLGACFAATSNILVDNESNLFLFGLCCVLTPLVAFALGRTRGTAALLFIVGVFIIVFIQFFYECYELVWALLFVLSSLALVIYKNYRRSVETVRSVKNATFASGFAVALGAVAASLAVGCGIWFGIIAPLNPPAVDIKLITEEHALETKQVKGVADIFLTPDISMTSSHTNDDERTTDDLQLVEDGRIVLANGNSPSDPEDDQQSGATYSGIDLESLREAFDFQNYETNDWIRFIAILAAIAALVTAYFVGRRRLRARRLAKIRKGTPAEQARALYLFLLDRFERIGFRVPPGQTLAEFAMASASARECFDETSGVAFSGLTDDYTRLTFGSGEEVTQERADDFAQYYRSFWKSCRSYLGTGKYLLKSFRL